MIYTYFIKKILNDYINEIIAIHYNNIMVKVSYYDQLAIKIVYYNQVFNIL